MTKSNTIKYYVKDHLGSIRQMADSSGNVVYQADYSAYGQAIVTINTVTPAFGCAGYFVHGRSNLNLSVHRVYSLSLARFLNRDTIVESGGINLYGYVGCDLVAEVDPSGEDALGSILFGSIGAGIGGAILGGGGSIGGTFIGSGGILSGGAIGWGGGAAIGAAIGSQLPLGQALSNTGQQIGGILNMGSEGQRNPMPAQGEPGSTQAWVNPNDGCTNRDFDSEGKAIPDFDFSHDHGAGDPHAHDWDCSGPKPVRGKGRPLKPGE